MVSLSLNIVSLLIMLSTTRCVKMVNIGRTDERFEKIKLPGRLRSFLVVDFSLSFSLMYFSYFTQPIRLIHWPSLFQESPLVIHSVVISSKKDSWARSCRITVFRLQKAGLWVKRYFTLPIILLYSMEKHTLCPAGDTYTVGVVH